MVIYRDSGTKTTEPGENEGTELARDVAVGILVLENSGLWTQGETAPFLFREAHPMQQLLETGIASQWVESGIHPDSR